MYALVTGPEWEDIEYFLVESHVLRRLATFGPRTTAFVIKYVSEDDCVFKKKGVYSFTPGGSVVYDGEHTIPRVRRGYDHDTDDDDDRDGV